MVGYSLGLKAQCLNNIKPSQNQKEKAYCVLIKSDNANTIFDNLCIFEDAVRSPYGIDPLNIQNPEILAIWGGLYPKIEPKKLLQAHLTCDI